MPTHTAPHLVDFVEYSYYGIPHLSAPFVHVAIGVADDGDVRTELETVQDGAACIQHRVLSRADRLIQFVQRCLD